MAIKQAIEANLLGDERVNSENERKDLKIEDKNNINILTSNLYSYMITIIYKN